MIVDAGFGGISAHCTDQNQGTAMNSSSEPRTVFAT
jgi:hypothetical protein